MLRVGDMHNGISLMGSSNIHVNFVNGWKFQILHTGDRFYGACLDPIYPVLVTEYCPRGSLQVKSGKNM